jgi:acetylornithine deacetylase/succinyl-diaminopimelate desuccinylase-like protein
MDDYPSPYATRSHSLIPLVAERLRGLDGSVDLVPPAADRPRITNLPQQFADMVVARFRGRGSARILLLAHIGTVYERGMLAQQPFRVDGDRAYGLGIADDKHAGNAPDQGRNAPYELSHQLLQLRDLSEPPAR